MANGVQKVPICSMQGKDRYKRVVLSIKQEGHQKMEKTLILNAAQLGKDLHLPLEYPIKYISFQLGAKASFNPATISGHWTVKELEVQLKRFIEEFLLCPNDKVPELMYEITGSKKKKKISVSCKACSYSGGLRNARCEKTINYIVNHPPPKDTTMDQVARKTGVPTEEMKKKGDSDDGDQVGMGGADDIDLGDTSGTPGTSGLDGWTTGGAVENHLSAGIKKQLGFETKTIDESATELEEWVQKNPKYTCKELTDIVLKIKKDDGHQNKEIMGAMVGILWDDKVVDHLKKCLPLYKKISNDKDVQVLLLRNIDLFCAKNPVGLKNVAVILRTLFIDAEGDQTGILSEDSILKWAAKGTSKKIPKEKMTAVRVAIQPIIDWIMEEEEGESYEEDDEDSEEEAPPPPKKLTGGVRQGPGQKAPAKKVEEPEDDDDFDIDDI